MAPKNENIKLWIIEQERKNNRTRTLKEMTQKTLMQPDEGKNHCAKCKKTFSHPKLVPVCPHCQNRIHEDEEEAETGCRNWFGYLNQKEKTDAVPQECSLCEKVMACMLNPDNSTIAVSEISKWY